MLRTFCFSKNMKFKLMILCLFVIGGDKFNVKSHELRDPVETTPENFPFQATIIGRYICGGALISRNCVITLARCVYKSSRTVRVYLGFRKYVAYHLDVGENATQNFSSSRIYIHEEFKEISAHHFLNDIALIELPQAVELTDKIHPGNFLSKYETHEEGFANVSGWVTDRENTMQVETVQLLNQDTCINLFGADFLTTQEFCAKFASTDPYLKGIAISQKNKILGLLSMAYPCNRSNPTCDKTYVFLNLIPYLGWISPKINVSIAEMTDNFSDITLIKVDALLHVIKGIETKFEKVVANIDEKLKELENRISGIERSKIH